MIQQLSIFVQNTEKRLSHILKILKDNDINIRTLTIVEAFDYGILRLILDDTDKARKALENNGIIANETLVMAAQISDKPGGMYHFVSVLSDNNINIEYVYSYSQKNTKDAIIIFKVKDELKEQVQQLLAPHEDIQLLTHDQLLKV